MQNRVKFFDEPQMMKIPEKKYAIIKTEVTQDFYKYIAGENPSSHIGNDLPVENVSWYDVLVFCNKLSVKEGLTPVYAVDGDTDAGKWGYTPHKGYKLSGKVTQNEKATGYRLPTKAEWSDAMTEGKGLDFIRELTEDDVTTGWFANNSGNVTHPAGQKKANGYGIYDMTGNVREWCWDEEGYLGYFDNDFRSVLGTSVQYDTQMFYYPGYESNSSDAYRRSPFTGFRVVRYATR